MSFGTTSSDPNTIKFDDFNFPIEFEQVVDTITENQLPLFDLLYDSDIISLTDGSATFDLTVNATDAEGDTIYYSINSEENLNKYTYLSEKFIDSAGNGDYEFFGRENFVSNCTFYDSPILNSAFWLGESINTLAAVTLAKVQGNSGLYTTGHCGWNYDFQTEFTTQTSTWFTVGIPDDGVKLHYMAYSGLGGQLFNLSIHQLDGRLIVANTTTVLYNATHPLFNSLGNNDLDITTMYYDNASQIKVVISNVSTDLIIINISYLSPGVQGFRFYTDADPWNGWLLDNIIVRGWNTYRAPVWSTDPDYSETYTYPDWYYVIAHVTDSAHIDDNVFDTKYVAVRVVDGQYDTIIDDAVNSSHMDTAYSNPIIGPARAIFVPLLDSFPTFRDTIWQNAWLFWILIFVGFLWFTRAPIISFFFANAVMLVLGLVGFTSVPFLVAVTLLLAISVAAFFVRIFIPTNEGRQ